MSDQQRRFDEWEVDCNTCAKYWDDSCDGVSKGSKRVCPSYVATRSVVLPKQIESLQRSVELLYWLVGTVAFLTIVGLFV